MRNLIWTLALAVSASAALATTPQKSDNRMIGDYVEARTASVFAGACHYGGEVTTTGREAEMVWHVREGSWNGVSVSGLNAMAAVVSDVNLKEEDGERRSILYVDAKATMAQADALTTALKEKYGKSLGKVVAVKRAPITFERKDENYRVEAKGVGKLFVDAMPNRECCKQPNLVWYKPMVDVTEQRVGFTRVSGIQEKALNANWTKTGANTAFYGQFAF